MFYAELMAFIYKFFSTRNLYPYTAKTLNLHHTFSSFFVSRCLKNIAASVIHKLKYYCTNLHHSWSRNGSSAFFKTFSINDFAQSWVFIHLYTGTNAFSSVIFTSNYERL